MKIIDNILVFKSEEEFKEKTFSSKRDINFYIFNKIKKSFYLNDNQVILFKIYSDSYIIIIKLKNYEWVKPLEICLKEFEYQEEYILCKECYEIIENIKRKATVK